MIHEQVVGNVVDKSISSNSNFMQMMSLRSGERPPTDFPLSNGVNYSLQTPDQNAQMMQEPFSAAVRATVQSVREICGQRIPPSDWREWMERMYGETVAQLPTKVSSRASTQTHAHAHTHLGLGD